jgi:K+-sensing histidine kinase KdpD
VAPDEEASYAEALTAYAKLRDVRMVVLGTQHSEGGWKFLRRSTVAALLRQHGSADVIVIGRDGPSARRIRMRCARAISSVALWT